MTGAITALRAGSLTLEPYQSVIVRVSHAGTAAFKPAPSWREQTAITGWTLAAAGAPQQKLERLSSWTELAAMKYSGLLTRPSRQLPEVARVASLHACHGECGALLRTACLPLVPGNPGPRR